jgi:uncharacterized protein (TIGR03435 family)
MPRSWRLTVGIVVSVFSIALMAQAPTGDSFEVASIKPSAGLPPGPSAPVPSDRFAIKWQTLAQLIALANRTGEPRVVGGPDWVRSDRFDITATTGAPVSSFQKLLMLQSLLADRFKLVMHKEARPQPVYALVMARSDKRLGPEMHASSFDCEPGPGVVPPPRESYPQGCSAMSTVTSLSGAGLSTTRLAILLMPLVGRTVVDRTGLTGRFDIKLHYTRDQPGRSVAGTAPDPDGPSIFTAVQEQLGLKLESSTAPVDFFVVDHIEHPTED